MSNDRTKVILAVYGQTGITGCRFADSNLTLVELPLMLVFNSLLMHLVFSSRIFVTRAIEVDKVSFIRHFQNRMISGQRIVSDCWKLQMAISAWGHFLLQDNTVRCKRCMITSQRTDPKQSCENRFYAFHGIRILSS